MIFDPKHSFQKYRLKEFNKKSTTDSKFEMIKSCYKDFFNLISLDAEPKTINQKLTVLNEVSKLYDNLIKEYKKVYEREPKNDKSYG